MNKRNVDFFSYIKNKKNALIIVVLLVLGLLLLILPNTVKSNVNTQSSEERLAKYTDELEGKIVSLCSKIYGVSRV